MYPCPSSRLSAEVELQSATQEDTSTPSPTSSDSHEDTQIVTLVEGEDEDEEPRQSTVILMEEGEEEEDKTEEEETTRREAGRNQWQSQAYCPFSSFSSLSLSCMATLPELLHRWCSARLAKERLRSLRRRLLSSQTRTDASTPVAKHTPPQISVSVPTPVQEALPLTENSPEPEATVVDHNEGKPLGEVHTGHTHLSHTPDAHTPELGVLLEPSRTSTIPPHSFSVIHSSVMRPTPTSEEKLLPPVPTPPLQAISIPETQQASSATPILTLSSPPQLSAETTPPVVVPLAKEQPVHPLPTASRPEDLIPPPTELPAAPPQADTHSEAVKLAADTGDSQINGEQVDLSSQTGEDAVDEELLSTNGNVQRTATDFYAELQTVGDYNGGALNGNGVLPNGGAVHGSSQKESVFMRLNNRIKALEMNMSLSSRYLEELSQRWKH